MEDKPNYRSIGRSIGKSGSSTGLSKLRNTISGNVRKSAPSVPSKWEQIETNPVTKPAKTGFGSQRDRFYRSFTEVASLNAQPGPGYFFEEKKRNDYKRPFIIKERIW